MIEFKSLFSMTKFIFKISDCIKNAQKKLCGTYRVI